MHDTSQVLEVEDCAVTHHQASAISLSAVCRTPTGSPASITATSDGSDLLLGIFQGSILNKSRMVCPELITDIIGQTRTDTAILAHVPQSQNFHHSRTIHQPQSRS